MVDHGKKLEKEPGSLYAMMNDNSFDLTYCYIIYDL
jgi:hypothetical protein